MKTMDRGLFRMGSRIPVTTYYRTISIDNKPTTVIIGPNGEPIKLPESLESLPKSDHFPTQRHRWNTNEEIASMLIAFDRHHDWLSKEVKIRPKSGSMLLYSRKKVRYRRDGYCWKKRKDGKTTREDHMKLKVQGIECIYGCYVHSAILPTFHRRCYWLLQNPDIVLVHYLNVPYPDDNKMMVTNSVSLWGEKKEWTKEELSSQLKPMFFSEEEPDLNSDLEISTAETVEALVGQLLEKQRTARDLMNMECSCPDSTCLDSKNCMHQMGKAELQAVTGVRSRGGPRANRQHNTNLENNNQFYETEHRYYPECTTHSQVSSTTGNGILGVQNHADTHSPASGHSPPGPEVLHPHLHPQQQLHLQQHPHLQHHHQHQLHQQQQNHHQSLAAQAQQPQQHHQQQQQHQPSLVLSLSQLQGTGGLVILNSSGRAPSPVRSYGRPPALQAPSPLSAATPSPTTTTCLAGEDLSTPASRGDIGSVTAAVNTLNNIHEFNLELTSHHVAGTGEDGSGLDDFEGAGGGGYTGLQPVTDSLLSGSESQKSNEDSIKSEVIGDNNNIDGGGRLLDFKSAFSDLDCKSTDMAFLDLSQDDLHRTLSANISAPINGDHHLDVKMTNGHHHQQNGHHIQQAGGADGHLTADRPSSRPHQVGAGHPHLVSGIDFVNGHQGVHDQTAAGLHHGGGPAAPFADVTLDPFDILSDFPDIAHYDSSAPALPIAAAAAHMNLMENGHHDGHHHHHQGPLLSQSPAQLGKVGRADYRDNLVTISDYSPTWSYTDAEEKVLVTGPWEMDKASLYEVKFNGKSVNTCLVQSGVLRCYAPVDSPGTVEITVTCDGRIISKPVMFQYKERQQTGDSLVSQDQHHQANNGLTEDPLVSQLLRLRGLMVARLEHLGWLNTPEEKAQLNNMLVSQAMSEGTEDMAYEDNLISVLMKKFPATGNQDGEEDEDGHDEDGYDLDELFDDLDDREEEWMEGATLLHLSASLGLTRLTSVLLHRSDHPRWAREANCAARDKHGNTPLMSACRYGRRELALVLCHWNPVVAKIRNEAGDTCFDLAEKSASPTLRQELEAMVAGVRSRSGDRQTRRKVQKSLSFEEDGCGRREILARITRSTTSGANKNSSTVNKRIRCISNRNGKDAAKSRLAKRSSYDSLVRQVSSNFGDRLIKNERNDSICSLPAGSQQSTNICDNYLKSYLIDGDDLDFPTSPAIHIDGVSSDDDRDKVLNYINSMDNLNPVDAIKEEGDSVLTMAEQFLAAMPPTITCDSSEEDDDDGGGDENGGRGDHGDDPHMDGDDELEADELDEETMSFLDCCSNPDFSDELGFDSLLDDQNFEFDFNFGNHYERLSELGTSISSLSPTSGLGSPRSFRRDSISPSISVSSDLSEFLQASAACEADLSNLTLNDTEQRELYKAAHIIQKAYRTYKGRRKASTAAKSSPDEAKQARAAIIIQSYYRRYKQYCYWKLSNGSQSSHAACCKEKRFQSSQEAATCIQNYYRNYVQCKNKRRKRNTLQLEDASQLSANKSGLSHRKQNQAASKIQQFIRKKRHLKSGPAATPAEKERTSHDRPPTQAAAGAGRRRITTTTTIPTIHTTTTTCSSRPPPPQAGPSSNTSTITHRLRTSSRPEDAEEAA